MVLPQMWEMCCHCNAWPKGQWFAMWSFILAMVVVSQGHLERFVW
jgi:hypothetical protein